MPTFDLPADTSVCIGVPISLAPQNLLAQNVQYLWEVISGNNTGTLSDPFSASVDYTPLAVTSEVRLTISNQCDTIARIITINADELPDLTIEIDNPNPALGEPIQFTSLDNSVGLTYIWDFGDGTAPITTTEKTISHVYADNLTSDFFIVNLTIENGNCSVSLDTVLNISDNTFLYVPNVFSPTATDQENQFARVYGRNVSNTDFNFQIYNRWGALMYESNSFDEANNVGWNGREMNTGEQQTNGVYTYILSGTYRDGSTFEQTGSITLIR